MAGPWERFQAEEALRERATQAGVPWDRFQPTQHDPVPIIDDKPDNLLGLAVGLNKPMFNTARALSMTNMEGMDKPYQDAFRAKYGYNAPQGTSLEKSEAEFNQYVQDKAKQGIVPGAAGQFGGELIGTMPAFTAGPFAGGAIASAMVTDERDPLAIAEDALIGGLMSKGGSMAFGYLGNKTKPIVDKGIKKLQEMGVETTIGQVSRGTYKRIEDKLTSVPLLGDMINARRNEGLDQFRAGVFDEVLKPLGMRLPDRLRTAGNEAYDYVSDTISRGYSSVLPKVTVQRDRVFDTELQQLYGGVKNYMGDAQKAKVVMNVIRQKILPNWTGINRMSGNTWKTIDADLGTMIRQANPSDFQYVGALRELQAIMRRNLERSTEGTEYSAMIKGLNNAFAKKVRVRDAVYKSNDQGKFTPQNLMTSVRQNSGREQFARGDAIMQDVADAGKMLPSQYGDSGTAGRLLMAGTGLLGAGYGNQAMGGDFTTPALVAGGLSALYSRPAQRVLARRLLGRKEDGPLLSVGKEFLEKYKDPLAIGFASQLPNTIDY